MTLNRYATARDANEPVIVEALRKAGATVSRLDTPLDLLVGYRRLNLLIEVKLPLGPRGGEHGSSLTPAQKDFIENWRGQHAIVRSPQEALRVLADAGR